MRGIARCDELCAWLQGARQKARVEKLEKIRHGQAVGGGKSQEAKALSKAFYGKLTTDADYVGEDYEVFSRWLGTTET